MSGPRDAATAQLCADLTSLMQSSPSSILAAAATPPAAVLSSPALPALSAGDVSDLFNTSVFQVPSASSTPSRSVFPSSGGGSGDNSQSGVVPQQQVAGGDSQSSHTFTDTQHASATPDVDVFASPVGGIHFDTGSIAGASSMSVSLEDNLLNSSLDTPHVLVSQEECTSEDESTTSSHPNVVGGGESDGGTKDVNPSTPAILAFEASLHAIMPSTRPTTPATPHVPSVIITTNADVHMPPVNVAMATSSDEDSDQEVVSEVDELDKEAGEQGDEDALHVTVSSSGSDVGGDGSGDGSDDSADPTYQPPKGDGKRRRFPKVPRLEGEASDGSGAPTGDDGNTDPGVTESNVVLTDPPEQAAADPSQSATVDKEKSTTTAVRTKVSRTGVLSRTSAWVWEYFSVPDGCTVATAEQVKCKLCTRMVKRGHLHKGFTLGTTALVSHMRLNHRAEFQLHDAPSPRKTAQGKAPPSGQSSSQTQSDDVVDLTRPGSSHDRQRIPPPPKVKRARKTKADRTRAGHVDGARQVVQHFQAASTPVPGISNTIPNVQTLYLHTYVVCALCHGVISSGETVGSARFSALLCHMRSNHPDSVTAEGEAVRPTVPSAVRPLTPTADAGQHHADVEASQEDDSDNAA